MFSKVTLRLFTPLLFLCSHFSFLNAQSFWERDVSFGTGGTVRTGGGRVEEAISGLALLPNGKILAAGRYGGDLSFIIARYLPNGQLDASFGTNGKSAYQLGGHYDDAKQILLLPDGRFILGASTSLTSAGEEVFSLIRFLPDGSPDNTFGTNGVAKGSSSPDLHDLLHAIALQPDGKIVAAGSTNYVNGSEDDQSVTLSRFTADGDIDNTFGINGVVRLPYPDQNYEFKAVAVQADGRIVAAGSNSDKIIVARFWPNGSLDNTFGTNGVKFLQYSAAGNTRCRAISLLPGGKILLGAWCHEYWYNNGAIAIRLLSDGSLDNTFHNGGMSFIRCDYQLSTSSMTLQNDGKIVLAATGLNNNPWASAGIFRFQPDGAPDSSFAINGAWVNPLGSEYSAFYAIKAMPDGKLLAGGVAKEFSDYDFALLRLQNDGTPDPRFGNGGTVFTDFGWGPDRPSSVHIRPDGKVLLTGSFFIGGLYTTEYKCALVQILSDGTLDASFGNGGVDTFPGGYLESVAFQPDGKILVGSDNSLGSGGHPVSLYRRLPNGGADNAFGQFGQVDSVLGGFNAPALVQVGVLSNGKIVVAGTVNRPGTSRDFILTCLHPDGSRDLLFGNNGFVLVDFNNKNDYVYGLSVLADDKILLSGTGWNGSIAKQDVVVMRFHPNGSFDNTWGQNGIMFDDFEAPIGEGISCLTFTPEGKLLLAVQRQITVDVYEDAIFDNVLARYNSDGSPDMAFGSDGRVVLPINAPYAGSRYIRQIGFLPNGKFATAEYVEYASSFLASTDSFGIEIKRYLPNGTADTLPASTSIISDTWGYWFGEFEIEMLLDEGIVWLAGSSIFDYKLNEDIILARYRFQPGCVAVSVQSVTGTELDDAEVNVTPSPSCPAITLLTECDDNEICLCGKDKDALFVVPYKNDNPLNGVSTYDLVLISKHILGLEPLSSPYKIIAADANRSGSVTTFDIVEIRKLILGIYQNLPVNTSWRFVRKDYSFPNPANPFYPPFPEKDTVFAFEPPTRLDYWAVKTGDVNQSHLTGCVNFSEPEPRQSLSFNTTWCHADAGSLFTVPVSAAEDAGCAAWQCALQFDDSALELVEVQPGEVEALDADNFGLTDAQRGVIRAVWYSENGSEHQIKAGETLFRLVFRAKKDIIPSEKYLSTDEATLACRAYRANGDAVRLTFDSQFLLCANPASAKLQSLPNPVSESVCFQMEHGTAWSGELRIFNSNGEMCFWQTVAWADSPERCFTEVAAWPAGLYAWRFVGEKGEIVEGKFLKH